MNREEYNRQQRLEIDRQLQEEAHKREWDFHAQERRQKYLAACEEHRQTLQAVLTDGSFVRDFASQLVEYDHRFKTAQEITNAIFAAGEVCRQENDLSNTEFAQLKLLLETIGSVAPDVDVTLPAVWNTVLVFLRKLSEPPREDEYKPLDFSTDTTSPQSNNPNQWGTRAYDQWERSHASDEWLNQTVRPEMAEAFRTMESDGVTFTEQQQKDVVAKWLERSNQSRRPLPLSVAELRKSALLLYGREVFQLTPDEEDFLNLYWDTSSSEDFKRNLQLRSVKSFDPHDAGYRVGRAGA